MKHQFHNFTGRAGIIGLLLMLVAGHGQPAHSKVTAGDLFGPGTTIAQKPIKSFDVGVEVINFNGALLDIAATRPQDEHGTLAPYSNGGRLVLTPNAFFVNVTDGTIAMDFMTRDGGLVTLAAAAGNSFEFDPASVTITSSITNRNQVLAQIDGTAFVVGPGERARIVKINIKQSHAPYFVRHSKRSQIQVVIFGSAYLDVNTIDPGSLLLEGLGVKPGSDAGNPAMVNHVDADEYPDLLVKFEADKDFSKAEIISAILKGHLTDGTVINGKDVFFMIP